MMPVATDDLGRTQHVVLDHIARRGPMPADRSEARPWLVEFLYAECRSARQAASERAASVGVARRPVAKATRARPREHRSSTRASRAGPSGDDDDSGPLPPRPRCSYCGTQLGEVNLSDQLSEWCCRRCYARQAPPDPPASAANRRREAIYRSIREHDRRETELGRRLRTGWEIVVGVGGLLDRAGLPVEYVGLPCHVGSLCPLCGAGLHVEDREVGVALECLSGCEERAIACAIGMGGGR
jgi:hypothetical protein